MLSGVAKAAARWRRLVTAAVRVSVWRPWAAARAGALAPVLATPRAASRNLLYETLEGRIALADPMVAAVEGPGRSKRKAEELSSPPPSASSAESQLSSRPRPPQRGPWSCVAVVSARAGAASVMA